MPKSDPLAAALEKMKAVEADPTSAASRAEMLKATKSGHSAVVERVAKIALKNSLVDLADDLAKAFERFLKNGADTDKGCSAKLAIATMLYETGKGESDTFVAGIHHVQMEPVWGKSVDTAGELRGVCALGLVRVGYRDVLSELADLLADKEPQARIAAARAIAYLGKDEGVLPLRTKILLGDSEPDVTGECMAALLRLAPTKLMSFVSRFLNNPDPATREQAMNAIAASKQPAAFELLRKKWDETIDPNARRQLLTAIAALRIEPAIAFLLEQIEDGSAAAARDTIEAMTTYRSDASVRARVETLVKERENDMVYDAFAKAFGRASV
jgi:HEAT repeat protein